MNYITTQKSEVPNSGWRRNFSLNRLLAVTYVTLAALGLINLIGTNALATQGIVLDKILTQTQAVTKESQDLTIQIGKYTNLSYIESTAKALGFSRVKNSYIITGSEAVASALR